jgi:hypothetical protein
MAEVTGTFKSDGMAAWQIFAGVRRQEIARES